MDYSELSAADLARKRGILKGQLTRFENTLGSYTPDKLMTVKARLEKCGEWWDDFQNLQFLIEKLDRSDAQEVERLEFENLYFDLVGKAKTIVDSSSIQQSSHSRGGPQVSGLASSGDVQLAPIDVPKFGGCCKEWFSFKEAFQSIIDSNQNLNTFQKFYYLKSALTGSAAELISNMQVTAANYQNAWDLLKDSYQNEKIIVYSYLEALCDFPLMQKESYDQLTNFLNEIRKNLRGLKALGQNVDMWDTLLIFVFEKKLDPESKRAWKREVKLNEFPSMDKFLSFLSHRCKLIQPDNVQEGDPKGNVNKKPGQFNNFDNPARKSGKYNSKSLFLSDRGGCTVCQSKDYHPLYICKKFISLTISAKRAIVEKGNVCWNCLRPGHRVHDCTYKGCSYCNKRHNSLLHVNNLKENNQGKGPTGEQESNKKIDSISDNKSNVLFLSEPTSSQVLLSTAKIQLMDNQGKMHVTRALLDSGSQSSFITSELQSKLGLPKKRINMTILGIGEGSSDIKYYVNTKAASVSGIFEFSTTFLVINKISDNIPKCHISKEKLNIPENLVLADKDFGDSSRVHVLLGSAVFWDLLEKGQLSLGEGLPRMQETKLGWIVAGPIDLKYVGNKQVCHLSSNASVQALLQKFWELEELPEERKYSKDELRCEEIFKETTTRDGFGRFVVALPLKENEQVLGNSFDVALQRFGKLEKRFSREENLKVLYHEFMQTYIDLGHMSRVCDIEEGFEEKGNNGLYYLPHHGVLKETSVTTKLRTVFDASAPSSSGVSLNDRLLVGPKLQEDLFNILIRFRQHKVVISGDVEKMYRQVFIQNDQRDLQRILWRFSSEQPIGIYKLNTVTYGTGPASFLAVRCLMQLAYDFKGRFPEASRIITRDFYMDDLLSGSATLEGAKILKQQISDILGSAGMILRKWMSNKKGVLEDDVSGNVEHYIAETGESHKTLGLFWNSEQDTLRLSVNLGLSDSVGECLTKRKILSLVAQIFDPLGMVGPVLVRSKLILQALWRLKLNWDDKVPQDLYMSWKIFQGQIGALNSLQVPRKIVCDDPVDIQLHCFADASQLAYGACIYVRSEDKAGLVQCQLLCSKSRVAPLKVVSLPRLELCGALLAARLGMEVTKTLDFSPSKVYFWTDSTIVLSWLAGEPVEWKTFVVNRTAEILNLTQGHDWHHVPSEFNPADVLSRGIDPNKLENCHIWWQGPDFLLGVCKEFPNIRILQEQDIPERRVQQQVFSALLGSNILERFSSFTRAVRVLAFCIRFKRSCLKHKFLGTGINGNLAVDELEDSRKVIIKMMQGQEFSVETKCLRKGLIVPKGSKIRDLNPFLDQDGILRVGGRLKLANMSFDEQHPIILPKRHSFTKLIILHHHYKNLHQGPQALLATIRLTYWPVTGRRLVKHVLSKCIVCFRVKPTYVNNIMGNLPRERVVPSRPFTNCGIDYAGPFEIKVSKLRGFRTVKAYLCAFVCFATKAVHFEVVSELTTSAFLNCFKRFVGRRGLCANIYSDNATNFVGGNNELKDLYAFLRNQATHSKFSDYFAEQNIKWHFIPPRSPHFGGLWEAVIKSAKYHIKRVVGIQRLTYEEFETVVIQAESCLNSRPLTPLTEDPDDLNILTPGHFLIGTSLLSLPQKDLQEVNLNRLKRFELLTQMVQGFWLRWSKDYLTQLQQRSKWHAPSDDIKVGTMVIIKESNLPPLNWCLGRIVSCYPGSDRRCRVVSIKTAKGLIKRAVSEICILPIERDSDVPGS